MSGQQHKRKGGGAPNKASRAGAAPGKRSRETLEDQINDEKFVTAKQLNNQQQQQQKKKKRTQEEYVGGALSKKILQQAREQQEELRKEEEDELVDDDDNYVGDSHAATTAKPEEFDDDNDGIRQEDVEEFEQFEDLEIDEEDERVLNLFMAKQQPQQQEKRLTIADLILEKIREKEEEEERKRRRNNGEDPSLSGKEGYFLDDDERRKIAETEMEKRYDRKVVLAYRSIGKILKTYKSGKLPKVLKIVPTLKNWEEILFFTQPEDWSPQATFQMTRLFASNFNSRMAQRFFNIILLPKIRDYFAENKKLNFHLYMSLKKALFKPAAFYKGIILPLCAEKTCTLREASILASVLTKVSIPVLHSAAALLKLSQLEYFGPNSLFIRVLIDKKYSLPFKVINALVQYFTRFISDDHILPVLWHQSLLAFVQRYKLDLTPEHKEALKALLRQHAHPLIADEIRRELFSSNFITPESGTGMAID